jgi:hypothetical protein
MLNVLPLAFAAAVYPTLLAGVIVMLKAPAPKRLLVGFLAGGWLVSLAAGLAIVFALQGAVSTSSLQSSSPTVDLVAGILSLLLAAVLWRRHTHPSIRPSRTRAAMRRLHRKNPTPQEGAPAVSFTQRLLGGGSPREAFVVGMLLNLPGAWYLVALKDIAEANYGAGYAVFLIFVFNAIMFLLAEVPLVSFLVSPERTQVRVETFQRWLSRNGRAIAATVALVIGVFLIVKAAVAGL